MSALQRWLAAFAALVVATGACAATDLTDTAAAYRRVTENEFGAYRAVLGDYERAARVRPRDVALAVARCQFISLFTDAQLAEDVSTQALEDLERCETDLRKRFAAEPDAQIFLHERQWDDDAAAHGDALLTQAQGWPRAARCRLLEIVTSRHEDAQNSARVGELAVEAVRLCDDTQRVAEAFRHLVGQRLAQPAATLLAAAPPATDSTHADARVRVALAHPDITLARRELERHREAGVDVDAMLQARALFRAGDTQGAAAVLPAVVARNENRQAGDLRFDLALALDDAPGAAAQIDLAAAASKTGWARQLDRYRRVVAQQPTLALQMPLLPLTAALFVIGAALLLLPGLLLVPAHYRGLIRRQRGRVAMPLFASVGLTKAWLALGLAALVPVVVAAVLGVGSGGASLGLVLHALLWSTLVQLALFSPWAMQLGRRGWLGTLGLRASLGLALRCWIVLFAVSIVIGLWLMHSGGAAETAQTRAVAAAVGDGLKLYGLAGTLLVLALLTPLCEEFVFRGMLLGGLSRHLSFGASNLLQACAFAAFHGDPPRAPFYIAMGLLAGWLVRRSGGLLPAFALHAFNNALFVLLQRVF
ncbi:MAG TPA: type II CAAX endopeptidase family protein [Tahibacter sp.]|nr:type II CAAX endopeptidase family protein [Tahibacter sp.]